MNSHFAPTSLKSMSDLSGVITICHLKSSSYLCLRAPPMSPLSFPSHDASRFWFTESLHVENITLFIHYLAWHMRKTHLLWTGCWDVASSLSCEWKVVVLVSHWLPNCTRRITCGECASTSAPQKHRQRWCDTTAPDVTLFGFEHP